MPLLATPRAYCILVLCVLPSLLLAQADRSAPPDTTSEDGSALAGVELEWFGGISPYLGASFPEPPSDSRPLLFVADDHNTFNLSLATLGLRLRHDRVRATIQPGFGTYMDANYAAERQLFRFLVEAHAGIRLWRSLWLEAGILPSPFGMEGAILNDQITLTRSLSAENSPYFLTGARLSYTVSDKLALSSFVVNGWQNIEETNAAKALAGQIQFTPTDKLTVNVAGYAGDEQINSDLKARYRVFGDIFAQYTASENFSIGALVDGGGQQPLANLSDNGFLPWYTANLIARHRIAGGVFLNARAELFADTEGVLIGVAPADEAGGPTLLGGSLGLDYQPIRHAQLRLEARYLGASNDYFVTAEGPNNRQLYLTAAIAASF